MSVELLKRVDRILQAESLIRSRSGELIPVRDILCIYSSGGVFAVRAGKDDAELEGALSSWEKRLRGLFMQTHRRYLVALDRIEGTYERFPLDAPSLEAMRHVVNSDSKRIFSFAIDDKSEKRFTSACEGYVCAQLERRFSALDYWRAVKTD